MKYLVCGYFFWGGGLLDYQKDFLETLNLNYSLFKEMSTNTLFQFCGEESIILKIR